MNNRERGTEAEERGVAYLRKKGYTILECNYRSRYGEIDIVARDRGTLVFIEVKWRSSALFGLPQEAVNRRKQEHMAKAALDYVKTRRIAGADIRFDVLAMASDEAAPELIVSAFEAPSKYTY